MPLSHLKIPPIPPLSPHTFTNELQARMLKALWINNVLMLYLCVFFTIKLLGVGQ